MKRKTQATAYGHMTFAVIPSL